VVIAGVVALAGLVGVVGSLGWLHLQPTGLSPVHNAVSQYGISAYRAGYRVATLTFAVAGVALAVAVSKAVHDHSRIVVWLLVFAAARILISWFPMDAPGTERTGTGQIHGLLAIAAFGSATIAAFRLGAQLSDQHRWHSLAGVSTALAWVMLLLLIAMAVRRFAPSTVRWFGAVERGFYLAAIAWFAVFAVAAVTS